MVGDWEGNFGAGEDFPATIGIFNGKIVIGLSTAEIEQLATAEHVLKVSRRDLAVALATRQLGATTVAGTNLFGSLVGGLFFPPRGCGGGPQGPESSNGDLPALRESVPHPPVFLSSARLNYPVSLL